VDDVCEVWFWAGLGLLILTLPVVLNLIKKLTCGGSCFTTVSSKKRKKKSCNPTQ